MSGDPFTPWLLIIRLGLNASALAAAGFALHAFAGVIEAGRRRAILRLASLASLAGLLFIGGRFTIVTLQLGEGAFDAAPFAWAALGPSILAFLLGAVLVALSALLSRTWLAAIGAVAIAAAFGLTGHAQGLDQPGAAPFAVAAHVLIAGFWVTAPLTLWPSARLPDGALIHRLHRFGRLAAWAIPLMFLIGMWTAWRLAGGVDALFATPYGQLLLAKLGASSVALAMGALNHRFVTNRVTLVPQRGKRWLKATLAVEAAAFLAAITLISIATTFTGPGEA